MVLPDQFQMLCFLQGNSVGKNFKISYVISGFRDQLVTAFVARNYLLIGTKLQCLESCSLFASQEREREKKKRERER
jgi:hypothetical protein